MHYIIKENGYVFMVIEHDEAGKFITKYNMGKDPDDPRWNEEKSKKSTKKEDDK